MLQLLKYICLIIIKKIKMKAIKNILIVTLLVASSITFAQDKKLSEKQKEQAKEKLAQYFEKLNLSETQKTSYETIAKKYGEELKFVKEASLSKQEKIKEVQRIQSEKDSELKELLSEEQYLVYQDFKTDQRKSLVENFSGEFSEYINRLNLTEDQKPQYIEISKRYGSQLKDLKNSSKSRFSKYRAYKSIQKGKNKEMKSLLSSKQYKVYLEIQKEVQKKMKEKRKEKK